MLICHTIVSDWRLVYLYKTAKCVIITLTSFFFFHDGESEECQHAKLQRSALGIMSISGWWLSVGNEVANHPIRQEQQSEPVERRLGAQQSGEEEQKKERHFHFSALFPPCIPWAIRWWHYPPSDLPLCPHIPLNLKRECAIWLWIRPYDEIFNISHRAGLLHTVSRVNRTAAMTKRKKPERMGTMTYSKSWDSYETFYYTCMPPGVKRYWYASNL